MLDQTLEVSYSDTKMKFVFLYGKPAVGKLSVAQELARMTGFQLLHNHLVVDLALSLYEFGSPGFLELREELWWLLIRRALEEQPTGLIFTFNPENSVPQRFVDEVFRAIRSAGVQPIVVELQCPEEEIERRLGAPSRRLTRKLTDIAVYRKLRDGGVFMSPVVEEPRLRIETLQIFRRGRCRADRSSGNDDLTGTMDQDPVGLRLP